MLTGAKADAMAVQNRARLLGYLGIVPFAVIALLMAIGWSSRLWLSGAMQVYAAIVLTFVGAIHWGRAMGSKNVRLLTYSVLPSLVGWFGTLLPSQQGLPLVASALLVALIFDWQQYAAHAWFRRLRLQLTTTVCLLLILGWAFSLRA
jgi:hypothetical protein